MHCFALGLAEKLLEISDDRVDERAELGQVGRRLKLLAEAYQAGAELEQPEGPGTARVAGDFQPAVNPSRRPEAPPRRSERGGVEGVRKEPGGLAAGPGPAPGGDEFRAAVGDPFVAPKKVARVLGGQPARPGVPPLMSQKQWQAEEDWRAVERWWEKKAEARRQGQGISNRKFQTANGREKSKSKTKGRKLN